MKRKPWRNGSIDMTHLRPAPDVTKSFRYRAVTLLAEAVGGLILAGGLLAVLWFTAPLGPKFAHFIDRLAHEVAGER